MYLIDTHAHLDFTEDKEGWIERAKEAGVTKIICIGTSIEASKKCAEIAEKYSNKDSGQDSGQARTSVARMTKNTGLQIYATVGIHSQDGKDDVEKYGLLEKCIDELRRIAKRDSIVLHNAGLQNDKGRRLQNDSKMVVAVGECGFDVHVTGDTRQVTSRKELQFQKDLFEAQIELAAELRLPLVVHCRNAWEEIFEVIGEYSSRRRREVTLQTDNSLSGKFSTHFVRSNNKLRGVFHSWTGDWEAAQKALAMGFYISFSGIVTFKNAPSVQEVAKKMPLDRMLLETDSPFLAPEPIRGSKNEPKNVRIIAEFVAKLRNLPVDQIASATSQNTERLFGI